MDGAELDRRFESTRPAILDNTAAKQAATFSNRRLTFAADRHTERNLVQAAVDRIFGDHHQLHLFLATKHATRAEAGVVDKRRGWVNDGSGHDGNRHGFVRGGWSGCRLKRLQNGCQLWLDEHRTLLGDRGRCGQDQRAADRECREPSRLNTMVTHDLFPQ
jgi:hypothetical protein